MDFSRRCLRFHHTNSRPTLSRLQRARRKNLYLSLEYTTFCLKKQAKKTISMKVQNFVTFPVYSRFKFGADVPLLPNGDIAHARRSDAPAHMGVSLIEKQRLFPDGKRRIQDRTLFHLRPGLHARRHRCLHYRCDRHVPQHPLRRVCRRRQAGARHRVHDLCRARLSPR